MPNPEARRAAIRQALEETPHQSVRELIRVLEQRPDHDAILPYHGRPDAIHTTLLLMEHAGEAARDGFPAVWRLTDR